LWMDASTTEVAALRTSLQLPVSQAEKPAPRLPSKPWKLVPSLVDEAKKDREIRRWRNRGILLALMIYLIVVAWMTTQLYLTSRSIDQLKRWESDHAQALALVRDTEAAWQELRPVVDEKNYPLELLLQIANGIPQDQLHLTLFEANQDRLLLKGEAKNVTAAFQFLGNLKQNTLLSDFTLEMPQPTLASNDLAKFTINGTYTKRD